MTTLATNLALVGGKPAVADFMAWSVMYKILFTCTRDGSPNSLGKLLVLDNELCNLLTWQISLSAKKEKAPPSLPLGLKSFPFFLVSLGFLSRSSWTPLLKMHLYISIRPFKHVYKGILIPLLLRFFHVSLRSPGGIPSHRCSLRLRILASLPSSLTNSHNLV